MTLKSIIGSVLDLVRRLKEIERRVQELERPK
jgi:hypothetical protein